MLRISLIVPAAGLLGLGFIPATAPAPAPVPACVEAHTWVVAHPKGLPKALADLSAYPAVYQRAIFGSLSNVDRVHLWREHLALYSGPASRLSQRQKRFIDSISVALPSIVAEAASQTSQIGIEAFARKATAERGERSASVVFKQLGMRDTVLLNLKAIPSTESGLGHAFRSLRAQARVRGPFALASYVGAEVLPVRMLPAGMKAANAHFSSCSCSSSGDFCDTITGPREACKASGGCTHTSSGCGWLWLQSCDGQCQLVEPQ